MIQDELTMSYFDYVDYLLQKHGHAQCDFFPDRECQQRSPAITRTAEGLECHHIDENKFIMLSRPEIARNQPFMYQKADRLVYADMLEHFLLHMKIFDENDKTLLGIGGALIIAQTMNEYYDSEVALEGWRASMLSAIHDKFDDYIIALKHLQYEFTKILPKRFAVQICDDMRKKGQFVHFNSEYDMIQHFETSLVNNPFYFSTFDCPDCLKFENYLKCISGNVSNNVNRAFMPHIWEPYNMNF